MSAIKAKMIPSKYRLIKIILKKIIVVLTHHGINTIDKSVTKYSKIRNLILIG